MKYIKLTFIATLVCCCQFAFSQNKDIDKGKETLKKAFEQKEAAKKNEMIQKATEQFQKGGMKREMNLIIGDAFLDKGDLTQASSYYGRCDKNEKMDGYKRLADAYVDAAFSDEKTEAKNLKSAVNFYNKSGKAKDGIKGIGDKFFEKGEKSYTKAVDYYFLATDTESVEKVARTYENKGGASTMLAVDLYRRVNTPSALKRAGDLCFEKKQYTKAYEAYSAGDVTEGLRKVAEVFYDMGQVAESENIFVKMVENYTKTANTEAIEKLGTENVKSMNFGLAARIYDKAGNLNLAHKYNAYYKFMMLDLDSAKQLLIANDDAALAKAIDANAKPLQVLKDQKFMLDDWANQQPFVNAELDPETGRMKPAPKDEQILVDYYKALKDQIVEACATISKNVNAVSNPELKKMLKKKFLEYPAMGKILDKETFTVKLTKANSQVKDVYLKKM